MAMNNSSSDQSHNDTSTKKPYEKPSFRFEEVFVTTALGCGKQLGGGGACALTSKS
jgi:hypothetical protein